MRIIVDALGLVHRAHFGSRTNPTFDERGFDISALTTVTLWLKRLRPVTGVSVLDLAWDCPGVPTWRHKEFPQYKMHRTDMALPLASQLEDIARGAYDLGYTNYRSPGFEADDIIATLAPTRQAPQRTLIVSADKDMLQLVNENVSVKRPLGPTDQWPTFGPQQVRDEFGVEPGQVPTLLALMGDKSDGIPGLRGVGVKKAMQMIREGRVPDTDEMALWTRLVTLRRDAPLELWEV